MGTIKVKVQSPQHHLAYGETLLLDYEVANTSRQPIFLVRERPTVELRGTRLEVSLAEQPMPEGAAYFGYRAPQLATLVGGTKTSERVTIAMPPRRATLGADGWEASELPLVGPIEVVLTIGYTFEPVADAALLQREGGPMTAFLEHQHTVTSRPLQIAVAGPLGRTAQS